MELQQISARLTGVGVGPGDPQLMTLRAVATLQAADCIAWMAARPGQSRARQTASACIPARATTLELPLPLAPAEVEASYDAAAERIAAELDAGRNVACLCEGDPLLYGSFMYLHARLGHRYPVRIVPGIASPTAASAALGVPLAAGTDRLAILPASLTDADLTAAMRGQDSVVFLKVGRHLPRLRALLDAAGQLPAALLVENASLPGERAWPLAEAPDSVGYFSLVLLRRGRAARL